MWMMGYNEGGADSFNGGRKLRPLIPRLSSCPTATAAANTNSDHRFNMGLSLLSPHNKTKNKLSFTTKQKINYLSCF